MTQKPRKRARRVALLLAGAATLSLAACKDDSVDAASFPDLQSCQEHAAKNSLWFSPEDCEKQFAQAQQNYAETAPRYESQALCEQEHGEGNCGADPAAQAGGGGSSFMPLLMGFMLGNILARGGVFGQPMVRTADGRFSTPAGNQSFASNRGAGKVAPATFNPAPRTIGRPPMSAAQVAQRGGFGAARTGGTGGSARSSGG